MKGIYLHDLSFSLGSRTYTAEESAQAQRILTAAEQYREAGFHQHRISADHENSYDLALAATQPIKAQAAHVTSLIYATCLTLNGNIGSVERFHETGDVKHLMNYPASHLQVALDIPEASVIGVNQQACTSILGAIRLASALLNNEPDEKGALCVTADRFPKGALYEQAFNLISDGASACIVDREPRGYRVLGSRAITNGALAEAGDEETVGLYFTYTHRLLTELAERAGLSLAQIDWLIPQNVNVNAWSILSRLLDIAPEKVYHGSMRDVAHIISSDVILNLSYLEKEGRIQSGQKIILYMAGFGLNWQAVLLEKV